MNTFSPWLLKSPVKESLKRPFSWAHGPVRNREAELLPSFVLQGQVDALPGSRRQSLRCAPRLPSHDMGGGGVGINNYSSTTLILVFQVPKYS